MDAFGALIEEGKLHEARPLLQAAHCFLCIHPLARCLTCGFALFVLAPSLFIPVRAGARDAADFAAAKTLELGHGWASSPSGATTAASPRSTSSSPTTSGWLVRWLGRQSFQLAKARFDV